MAEHLDEDELFMLNKIKKYIRQRNLEGIQDTIDDNKPNETKK